MIKKKKKLNKAWNEKNKQTKNTYSVPQMKIKDEENEFLLSSFATHFHPLICLLRCILHRRVTVVGMVRAKSRMFCSSARL